MTTTTTSPATEKQISFLRRLAAERVAVDDQGRDDQGRTIADVLADRLDDVIARMTKAQASKTIDLWLQSPKATPSGPMHVARVVVDDSGRVSLERQTPEVVVPEGHYAVASATGNNDLDFFRVDRPTDGKWAGYTFVKRIVGGHPEYPVRGAARDAALARIAEAGPDAAAVLYGQTIGRCYRCNRTLTDETSRELGIGPDCRTRD